MPSLAQRIKSRLRRASLTRIEEDTKHEADILAKKELARLEAAILAEKEEAKRAKDEYNQLYSPFLRLPGELRNKSYGYALGGQEIFLMGEWKAKVFCHSRSGLNSAPTYTPIAQTMALHLPLICRQIRLELGET